MPRSNDLLVGSVVLLVAAALVGATLWAKQADVGGRRPHVVARFRDVGNVQLGNPVVIRGVRAGRVEGAELADDGWVHMRISLDPDVELPRDPAVLLGAASLFGEWQAAIVDRSGLPPDDDVRRQVADAAGEAEVLPGATLPDIAQLTAVAGRIAGDVAKVADRVEVAFDARAAAELRSSIRNFADLSSELARMARAQSTNLEHVSVDMRQGGQALAAAARAVERTAARVDSSTSGGELRAIVGDVSHAADQLRATADRLRDLAERLGRSEPAVTSVITRADTLLARLNAGQGSLGLLVTDPTLYRSSDSLVREIRALVTDIKANPKRYITVKVF